MTGLREINCLNLILNTSNNFSAARVYIKKFQPLSRNTDLDEKRLLTHLERLTKMTYEKFEPSESLAESIYNAIEKAEDSGEVRIGTNEVTKAIERNEADLIVIASDVSPEEVVMHLPALADERDIPFTYVPDKEELGLAAGIEVQSAAVAVTKVGNAEDEVEDVAQKSMELLDKDEEDEE